MRLERSRELTDGTVAFRRRSLVSRISGAHLLTLLVALVAFVLNMALLRDPESRVVAVADQDLAVGDVLAGSSLRWVEMSGADDLGATLLTRDDLAAMEQATVRAAVLAGDPILRSAIGPPAAPSGLRAFTIDIDQARAGGGAIATGDVVDVISTTDGLAAYVALAAEVLAVPAWEQRGLSTTGYFVTVAVDAETALALAEALDRGRVDVVLSTGAPPPAVVSPGVDG